MEMITLFSDKRRHQSLVGKLIYLTVTRLDIIFPIRIMSQFICGNLFIWRSKQHNVVAIFSGESEYRAMAHQVCELMWIQNLLQELGFSLKKPMIMYCDNQIAIHNASNSMFHGRTKHMEVDYHFIKEIVMRKKVITPYNR